MKKFFATLSAIALPAFSFASEADLKMPEGFSSSPDTKILYWGFLIVALGLLFGFWQFSKVRKLKAHKSMLEIGNVIFKTCSTYLKQQGKFLIVLFLFIGAAIALYFGVLSDMKAGGVLLVLAWTIIGILRCGLVWRAYEHACQCSYGFCLAAPPSARPAQHSSARRYEHWYCADLR